MKDFKGKILSSSFNIDLTLEQMLIKNSHSTSLQINMKPVSSKNLNDNLEKVNDIKDYIFMKNFDEDPLSVPVSKKLKTFIKLDSI